MAEAELWSERTMALRSTVGVASAPLLKAARAAQRMIMAYGDTAGALRVMDQALAATPIERIDLLDRPYPEVGAVYAAGGRADRAKQFLAGVERQYNEKDAEYGYRIHRLRAEIAMAERRWDDAIRHLPADMPARCSNCLSVPRAEAYDARGDADSALVWYLDQAKMPGALGIEPVLVTRRLGELYSAKGDIANALVWYQRFVDAWKDAEPRLQPQVADVRRRIARLKDAHAR
jgi:tetratricopeptide (TPR) repeat protein